MNTSAPVVRIRRKNVPPCGTPAREVAGGVNSVVSGCRRAARMAAWLLTFWVAAALICGCARPRGDPAGAAAGPPHGDRSVPLTVFAAASLTECLDEFAQRFERSHPGTTVRANYAGTQELRIYDLNGRIAFSGQMELPGDLELPGSLPGGIYIIEIRTSGSIYRGRLVKR